jgi:N-acetylmuramoyl-L-alanine amidase
MKLSVSTAKFGCDRVLTTIGIALVLCACAAVRVRADQMAEARNQFARAVTMRTMLEGYLEKDRSLTDYKKTVAAYRKVYLITADSEDCTAALMAEGELYDEMGRLYDAKYFAGAIDAYEFLVKQYPGSRYRGSALLAIASIQKDELHNAQDAQATYKRYLKLYPHSEKAHEVLADLRDVTGPDVVPAGQPSAGADQLSQLQGERLEPRASEGDPANVTSIRTSSVGDATRIIVGLDNNIRYTSARITSPDRIYFDLYKANLSPKFSSNASDVTGGLLKSVRVAQNRQGVVRIVLDVSGTRDYSAYLLGKPYRLVIDVGGPNADRDGNSQIASAPANTTKSAAVSETVEAKARASHSKGKRGEDGAAVAANKSSSKRSPFSASTTTTAPPANAPPPTHDGKRSLARVLGLKVRRIVIDPGHGGHDTGTIGRHGLEEKDVCLDVALRLGKLIEQKLPGAEVIYTRKTDVFVPLEERTAIANQAHADLFISIHVNSSRDHGARGVETYYLNFATSPEAMAVAARENATSEETEHDLPDLLKKIARNDKIEESKELAEDVQDSLSQRLELVSRHERNRGVKKAPFVVLIGANMPSVLAEISFLSNLTDEHMLRKPEQRQQIATGLYRGIAEYLKSLNSLTYDKQNVASDRQTVLPLETAAAVATTGNSK